MSSNPPPYQGPQHYMPRQNPNSALPPTSKKWVIWLVSSIIVVCGVCGFGALNFGTHSGVIVDGKELTRLQVMEGKREVRQMMKKSQDPDAPGLDDSVPTTNPLTKKFRQLYAAIQEQERSLREYNAKFNIAEVNKSMLTTQTSRDDAKSKFVEHDAKMNSYFDAELKVINELQQLCVQVDGKESTEVQQGEQKLQTGKVDYQKVQAERLKLLQFLDITPHQNNAAGQALFATDAEVNTFNTLVDNLQRSVNLYASHLAAGGKK